MVNGQQHATTFDSTTASTRGSGDASLTLKQTDAVAKRIMAAGEQHAVSALQWLDAKRDRVALRRRAAWCVLGSWCMVTAALAVGAFVAWTFSNSAKELFVSGLPLVATILPPVLICLTGGSLLVGTFAWINQSFPGLASTQNAIDWSGTGDAISRLLSVGCTYPEAFETAAKVAATRRNRSWLISASHQVEIGGFQSDRQTVSKGDEAIVELLVQTDESNPSESWQIVSDHFVDVSRSRLSLLLSTGPVLSTLLAGLIVWLAISSTLGSMWRHAFSCIQGLS